MSQTKILEQIKTQFDNSPLPCVMPFMR